VSGLDGTADLPRHLRSDFDLRAALLEEVLTFTRAASAMDGVVRIALIGSITTSKSNPKDCDLLVSLMDDADMAGIAKLGRRLKGRTGSMASGADVFICDENHRYLGRVCEWKQCWPRVRCQAHNCGRRPGLYDDLDVIRLDESTTLEPQVELYPQVVVRGQIPADVTISLIRPLLESANPEATGA
jgi:hypothetical protein